jgi:DNA-binding NarL/FixJ family response regulator
VNAAVSGAPLTTREREILEMIADGANNRAIASRLGISRHTVKFHVASILGKLDAGSRTEAVATALRGGLLAV